MWSEEDIPKSLQNTVQYDAQADCITKGEKMAKQTNGMSHTKWL